MEIQRLAEYCDRQLDLASATLGSEYFYQSLPLCVIDAVWSIGIRYKAVQNVVKNYCDYFGYQQYRHDQSKLPQIDSQNSIDSFIDEYNKYGIETFTNEIYDNRQRTSSRNGILKSEAVLKFANILKKYKIDNLQTATLFVNNANFELDIKSIPGQGSGLSFRYFLMLSGHDNFIKFDRMIKSYTSACLIRSIENDEAELLLKEVASFLKPKYPDLTPRLLDYAIWQYQRAVEKPKKICNGS